MSERIFLTYTNATAVPYQGSALGHHVVINYVVANGLHHTLQGIPEHSFEHNADKLGAFLQEEMLSDGVNNRDSPFRRLQAHEGIARAVEATQPFSLIAEGNNLRPQWDAMNRFAREVDRIGYEYRPYSQNSNSFAAGALRRAGLFGPGSVYPETFDHLIADDPATGVASSFFVPGFEQRLKNPLNAFEERFGDWTPSRQSALTSNTNRSAANGLTRPIRNLDGPFTVPSGASPFDTGAPVVPFVVNNEPLAPAPA